MKESIALQRKRRILLPILILLVVAFTLYTVIDTAVVYRSISIWAVVGCTLIFGALIFAICRFTFVSYEYLIVGDELVIRRKTLRHVSLVNSYPLSLIQCVDKIGCPHCTAQHAKRFNLCNTPYASLVSGLVMTYRTAAEPQMRQVLIDPPCEVKRLLKLNLERRYHG